MTSTENERKKALGALAEALKKADESGYVVKFKRNGGWPAGQYRITKDLLNALRAAIGSGRALLVRGEPGSGKSTLARAAAKLCNRSFSSFVVQPNTQYEDLLWNVDHIERMGEAQRMGIAGYKPPGGVDDPLSIEHFIVPGPLWLAFDPSDAMGMRRHPADQRPSPPGRVLLIDEIDKADASVCNGLLESLGNFGFNVPPLNKSVYCEESNLPLVILTSNDLRPLPDAFVRRCAVVDLPLRESEELVQWLVGLGKGRFSDTISHDTLVHAAQLILSDRSNPSGPKAGTAEYLSLIHI